MANCNECIKANPINRCSVSIYIPHVSGPQNEDYLVTIRDVSTGRFESELVTATGHALTVPIDFELMNGHVYEIKAYHDSNPGDAHTLQVGGEEGCCIQFETLDILVGTETNAILNVNPCNSATND